MWKITSRKVITKRFLSGLSKTTEEKAAEIGVLAWPAIRKYGPIGVPVVLGLVTTAFVVNNKRIRYAIEDIFPAYVKLVREYYGFHDEDLAEVHRVKKLLIAQSKDIDVKIVLLNGESVRFTSSGSRSYKSLVDELVVKYSIPEANIEFLDSPSDNENNLLGFSVSNERDSKILNQFNGFESWTQEKLMESEHVMILPYWKRSHWDQSPFQPLPKSDTKYSKVVLSSASPSHDLKSVPVIDRMTAMHNEIELRHTLIKRALINMDAPAFNIYCNVLQSRMQAIRDHLQSLGRSHLQITTPLVLESSTLKKQISSSAVLSSQQEAKLRAKMEIDSLRERLQTLQSERSNGRSSRDMDAIQQDIQEAQTRIKALQRTHFNHFYFF